MRLYVANPTRQNRTIYYRLDVRTDGQPTAPHMIQPAKQAPIIAPGKQIALGGMALNKEQVDALVRQLNVIGAVPENEINRIHSKVTPLIYSVDAEIPAKSIRKVFSINSGVLIGQGKERRMKAAIAANETVTRIAHDELSQKGIDIDPNESKSEFEFEQLDSEDGGKLLAEGMKIDPNATPHPSQKNKKKRARG